MKSLIIFALLIVFSLAEVEIDQKFAKAKSFSEFHGKKIGDESLVAKRTVAENLLNLGDVPHFALLYVTDEDSGEFYASSGSLIHHQWILTTAAVVSAPVVETYVYLGIVERFEELGRTSSYAQWFSDKLTKTSYYPHSQYDETTYANNVGLLKIPLTENTLRDLQHVALIALPRKEDENINLVGLKGSAAAFGISFETMEYVMTLREAKDLEILSQSQCQNVYQTEFNGTRNFCAENSAAPIICDQGGPFVTTLDGKLTQIGIVQFSLPHCLSSEYPILIDRVSNYIEFIKDLVGAGTIAQSLSVVALSIAALLVVLIK